MRDTKKIVLASMIMALFALAFVPAVALDTYWQHDPSTPGDWHDPANWDNGVPVGGGYMPGIPWPYSGDSAYINNGGTVQVTADGSAVAIYAGYYYDAGFIEHTGGTLSARYLEVGRYDYSSGTYILSGNGRVVAQDLTVGGLTSSSTGTFVQNGGLNMASRIFLGGLDGRYYLYDGEVSSEDVRIGIRGNGNGTFTQSGGTNAVADLCLGFESGGNGTYNLSGTGQLSASREYIGYKGTGEFSQTGGTNTVSWNLYLGRYSGSSGTYNLSGTAQLSAGSEYIGNSGTGEFNQTGGTHTVDDSLYLGYESDSSGTYNLSGTAQLSANYEYIGYEGTGEFNQSGGTNNVGYLLVKCGSDYTLSGGTLSTGDSAEINGSFHFADGDGALNVEGGLANFTNAVIDGAGSASFSSAANSLTILPTGFDIAEFGSHNASGMIHNAGSTLAISSGEGFAGRGWISDHVINRGEIVASGGSLDFRGGLTISDGGTLDHRSHSFIVDSDETITIAASGGQLLAKEERIGYEEGTGEFNQSGGTNTVTEDLYVGCSSDHSGLSGTYNLGGTGQLSAGSEYIGNSGTGEFNQDGGVNTVSDTLYIGYGSESSGVYNLQAGELVVGEDIIIDEDGVFNDNGATGAGGRISVWGDFVNNSESPELFSMTHTTLTMWGGMEESLPAILDMNSVDVGADCAGLVDNFALGTLIFEGSTIANPEIYNRLESDVYTYGLVLNEGAFLDLNGYTLYYLPLGQTYNGIATTTQCLGGTWYGGDIVALSGNIIPEPGALLLLAPGLFGIVGLLRRKFQ